MSIKAKKIAIFGSTGSVGRQSLEVAALLKEHITIEVLTAFDEVAMVMDQVAKFQPKAVVMVDNEAGKQLKDKLTGSGIRVLLGSEGLTTALDELELDLVLNAIVGAAGMETTFHAVDKAIDVALANKESLVVAGEVIMPLLSQRACKILPVDSEHSAIYQCLQRTGQIRKVIITASGGPFWRKGREEISSVKAAEALCHPNWNMGPKITIDSATFMNKGLEVIEAHWLFDMPYDRIEAVIHPESIIHSMVEYDDGAVIAQLALPDMRLPIAYALSYPDGMALEYPKLDFMKTQQLNFAAIDVEKFPCFKLALDAGKAGGSLPAVMNAANEVAVDSFIQGRISFYDIPAIIQEVMGCSSFRSVSDLDAFKSIDDWARKCALEKIKNI